MCIRIHILSKFTNYFVKQLKNDHSSLFKVNLRSFININSKKALSKVIFLYQILLKLFGNYLLLVISISISVVYLMNILLNDINKTFKCDLFLVIFTSFQSVIIYKTILHRLINIKHLLFRSIVATQIIVLNKFIF